ncbi:MAG TPA: hypothetical protein VFS76_16560 [Pyrinomonadaceae bacterium]|nr:hypothetical protein [Pyrinomonadaceae bacterium]
MFNNEEDNFIKVELNTTFYLGRQQVAEQFCDLLLRYDGIYLPEKWDNEQRAKLRRPFDPASQHELIQEWTRPEEWKIIFFTRKRPPIEMSVDIKRFSHAKFNKFSAYIDERHFKGGSSAQKELLDFTIEMSLIARTDYGFIAHKRQERRQSPVLTPAERLSGIYWANFFGRPYIEFFGREKLLATPCYEVREISADLILLLTSDSLNAPEMLDNDEVVNQIKAYLNQNAFAGPNFPDESCSVPKFNFGDVRWTTELPIEGTTDEKVARLRTDLETKGYKLIEEKDGRLVLRGADDSVIIVDTNRSEVSVDLTGRFLETFDE